jgi:hypothetical protein
MLEQRRPGKNPDQGELQRGTHLNRKDLYDSEHNAYQGTITLMA